MQTQIQQLHKQIESTRMNLLSHPVYAQINDLKGLQQFASMHVFAVWDFMSLLKSLQIGLTSVTLPWLPVGNANTRFLINEIVTGEESDVDEFGNRMSHFELYLSAMQQMGADTHPIQTLITQITSGKSIQDSIQATPISENVKSFLNYTFEIAQNAPLHIKAAVFTFGREDLIPDMFTALLDKIYAAYPEKVSTFKYYIQRHIEVDGDHHSHLATQMVADLCGEDSVKWEEATQAALKSLTMRSLLWDAIMEG